ncbi:MAG: right-handed parallel beta-helix repeat-containing protein [Candidatus Heimdallarchaeota archaeon]|nr:right-handed parallel beta-helix repeat-containing protein [Candidatus Heimdallarchaeota archaeon]
MSKKRTLKSIKMLFCLSLFLLCLPLNNNASAYDESLLVPSEKIVIHSDDDFEALGLSGSGTEADPYLIENLEIMPGTFYNNIEITNTTKHFIIRNCHLKNGFIGISIIDAAEGTVQILENLIEGNQKYAIWLENTNDAYIAKNILGPDTLIGVRLENCSSVTITENICDDNGGAGIIYANSDHITVTKNTVKNNEYIGIQIKFSNDSLIAYNQIEYQTEYGIKADLGSCNNIIHHNNLISNNVGTNEPQAYDGGFNNLWYDEATLEGNYWDDWNGEGNYSILGTANCCDPYPLAKPYSTEEASFPYYLFILTFIPLTYIIQRKRKR